jgi:hypothetical protein
MEWTSRAPRLIVLELVILFNVPLTKRITVMSAMAILSSDMIFMKLIPINL